MTGRLPCDQLRRRPGASTVSRVHDIGARLAAHAQALRAVRGTRRHLGTGLARGVYDPDLAGAAGRGLVGGRPRAGQVGAEERIPGGTRGVEVPAVAGRPYRFLLRAGLLDLRAVRGRPSGSVVGRLPWYQRRHCGRLRPGGATIGGLGEADACDLFAVLFRVVPRHKDGSTRIDRDVGILHALVAGRDTHRVREGLAVVGRARQVDAVRTEVAVELREREVDVAIERPAGVVGVDQVLVVEHAQQILRGGATLH